MKHFNSYIITRYIFNSWNEICTFVIYTIYTGSEKIKNIDIKSDQIGKYFRIR